MTSALVIGYGSIGQRHVRLLRELGCDVAIVSRREADGLRRFSSIDDAFRRSAPEYVVIANETAEHADAVEKLQKAGFSGRVLIEKPLGKRGSVAQKAGFGLTAVAYNLRFHPILVALREAIAKEDVISIQVYCGQYLPDWRPGRDYRKSYSADPDRGGGVLRDLSHELDYLLWMAGGWRRVTALGGKFSDLEIRSDDSWAILTETERCPLATIQINYLDRPGARKIVVNTASHTYRADLVRSVFEIDGKSQVFEVDRDDTYLAQHKAILSGDTSRLCSLAEGMRVMQFIDAVERAARERTWISA